MVVAVGMFECETFARNENAPPNPLLGPPNGAQLE